MAKSRLIQLSRAIIKEIITGLPGRHRGTSFKEPENPLDFQVQRVFTGAINHDKQVRVWERFLGTISWFAWFGFGIYFWWFTSVPILDYVIGVVVWTFIFLFTLIGIPIFRVILREREKI